MERQYEANHERPRQAEDDLEASQHRAKSGDEPEQAHHEHLLELDLAEARLLDEMRLDEPSWPEPAQPEAATRPSQAPRLSIPPPPRPSVPPALPGDSLLQDEIPTLPPTPAPTVPPKRLLTIPPPPAPTPLEERDDEETIVELEVLGVPKPSQGLSFEELFPDAASAPPAFTPPLPSQRPAAPSLRLDAEYEALALHEGKPVLFRLMWMAASVTAIAVCSYAFLRPPLAVELPERAVEPTGGEAPTIAQAEPAAPQVEQAPAAAALVRPAAPPREEAAGTSEQAPRPRDVDAREAARAPQTIEAAELEIRRLARDQRREARRERRRLADDRATRELQASKEAVPEVTAPEDTAPEDTAPEDTAPEDAASENAAPENTVPENTAPENTAPAEAAPSAEPPEEPPAEHTVQPGDDLEALIKNALPR